MKTDTFGKTKAAICLAQTLNQEEYKRFQRPIATLFSKYNHVINQIDISKMEEPTRKTLLHLVRNKFKSVLFDGEYHHIPEYLKRFIFNIFTANYRKAIRGEKDRNDWCKKQKK